MRFYFVSWLGERVVADIRLRVHRNLLRLAPAFYEENSPKEISSRMTSDTALIEQVVGTTVSVALRNLLMAIGGTIYLFYLVPGLTVGLVLIIPAIVVPITYFGRRLRKVSRTSQDRVADIGAMVTEVLSAMKIVQGFNQETREADRFQAAVERTFGVARRRIAIRAAMTAIVILFVFGGITLLVWRGATAVSEGTITGGTIAAFVLTAGLVAGAFGALTEVYGDLLRGAGPCPRAAACPSATSLSAIRPGPMSPRSRISASKSNLAKPSPSSGHPERANRPSSSWPSDSTIRRRARCGSTGLR
jgi:ATP-binding cassette subfamily B protein